MIRTIPLNKLVPSPRNVRRSTDEQADLQLKADIEARGLLQNLVVTSVLKPRGSFAVEAGGRRLKALQRLAAEGRLPKGHEVCCLVIEDGPAAAQEASLAENFQRLSMNPADECIAFGQLIEQGSDVEGIARRFGLTVRFVEGRLRLAGLAPIVFEALGAGAISLDVAKAYAVTPDRERQAWVYEQLGQSYAANHPDSIRRMMTQATASGSDRRARLVGEEAYVAAGGRIERDLFSDDGATRWLDVPLLERLAAEEMEALAAETAAELGLAWVRPTLESWVGADKIAGLRRIVPQRMPLTHEEAARVEEAQGEIEVLVAVIDDEDVPDATREESPRTVCHSFRRDLDFDDFGFRSFKDDMFQHMRRNDDWTMGFTSRYQSDPARRAVLDAIMAETARAKDAQRDRQWITYLVRDPRYPDKRGNPGTPIYVGQTNDLPQRVLSRFMKCEKEAAGKETDCIERRVADLLHLGIVATYQVLEYQPTHLTSLISETNWARRCWNAGYDLANRAELQNTAGSPIDRTEAVRGWLLKFSLAEAIADDIRVSISCKACGEVLPIPLREIPEIEKLSTTIGQLRKLWRSQECTFCGIVGARLIRVWVD